MRLTAQGLSSMTQIMQFGDMIYLPRSLDPPLKSSMLTAVREAAMLGSFPGDLFVRLCQTAFMFWLSFDRIGVIASKGNQYEAWQELVKQSAIKCPADDSETGDWLRIIAEDAAFMFLFGATQIVNSEIEEGNNKLFNSLPDTFKRHVLVNYRRTDVRDFEPFVIYAEAPYTGIQYQIEEAGLTHDCYWYLGLHRLMHIRQLAMLVDPVFNGASERAIGQMFNHTRYTHSLHVRAIALAMGINVDLSERELKHLEFASLTHDILTPAGGDTMKWVDREAFDEDKHYPDVFLSPNWPKLRKKYDFDESLILSIIRHEGIAGQLLNIADRIGYTSPDAYEFYCRYRDCGAISNPEASLQIATMIESHPFICGFWDKVRVMGNDKVYFQGAKEVADFLRLRALLIRYLYANPAARFHEAIVMNLALKKIYPKYLSRQELLSITDEQLRPWLDETTGVINTAYRPHAFGEARVEYFQTEKEALRRAKKVAYPVKIEDLTQKIKPQWNLFVYDEIRRNVYPVLEDPHFRFQLERMATPESPWCLYYFNNLSSEMNPKFRSTIEQHSLDSFPNRKRQQKYQATNAAGG